MVTQECYRGKVEVARKEPLEQSFVLDEDNGNTAERIYVLFNDAPFNESELIRAASKRGAGLERIEQLAVAAVEQASFLVKR